MPVRPSLRTEPAPIASVPSDKPFWTTSDGDTVRLFLGDVIGRLKALPAKSVQCVITSPPYFALRDYGTALWTGGNPDCPHKVSTASDPARLNSKDGHAPVAGCPTRDATERIRTNSNHKSSPVHKEGYKSPFLGTATGGSSYLEQGSMTAGKVPANRRCPLGCGAVAEDHQLGSEARPDCGAWASGGNCAEGDGWYEGCHVCRMTLVFREVRRVLRDDGVCAINYGDTYVDNQLQLIPARVALALQADGWLLRSDIPWVKLSAMPESARNRPCKALEYVYLFAKAKGYFWDCDAIRKVTGKEATPEQYAEADGHSMPSGTKEEGVGAGFGAKRDSFTHPNGRNFRNADLWFESVDGPHGLTGVGDEVVGIDVTSESYGGAHFAAFGSRLITPFILAGTSAHGSCAKCGSPWRRVTDRTPFTGPSDGRSSGVGGQPDQGKARLRKAGVTARDESDLSAVSKGPNRNGKGASTLDGTVPRRETVAWEPTCTCHGRFEKRTSTIRYYGSWTSGEEREHGNVAWKDGDLEPKEREASVSVYVSDLPLDRHPVVPCVVMDPFVGSGTTCAVAVRHGRRGWGIDLSETYLRDHAVKRVTAELLSRPATAHLVPRPPVVRGRGTAMVLGGGKSG